VATPDAVTLRWNWPFSHTVLAVVETPAVATVAVRTRLVRGARKGQGLAVCRPTVGGGRLGADGPESARRTASGKG